MCQLMVKLGARQSPAGCVAWLDLILEGPDLGDPAPGDYPFPDCRWTESHAVRRGPLSPARRAPKLRDTLLPRRFGVPCCAHGAACVSCRTEQVEDDVKVR